MSGSTVVTKAPEGMSQSQLLVRAPLQFQEQKPWHFGIFSCLNSDASCSTCLYGWCCTPCLIGTNGENLGRSCIGDCFLSMCCIGFLGGDCLGSTPSQRNIIRRRANLAESCCNELLIGWCCYACAACQHANEMELRGLTSTGR